MGRFSRNQATWQATLAKSATCMPTVLKRKMYSGSGKISYPFLPYGNEEVPKAENLLIKNATVWTSDAAGKWKIPMCW
jgi:hypothetical protein